jgi:hypothetical protein
VTPISSADFLHQRTGAFASLRVPCVARSRLEASILP